MSHTKIDFHCTFCNSTLRVGRLWKNRWVCQWCQYQIIEDATPPEPVRPRRGREVSKVKIEEIGTELN